MKTKDSDKKSDILFVHSQTQDRSGYRVLRANQGNLEVGEMKPVQEGQPIRGEVVQLSQRKEHARLFDVKVLASPQKELEGSRAGPARVANETYRHNWEMIFGNSSPKYLN